MKIGITGSSGILGSNLRKILNNYDTKEGALQYERTIIISEIS